MFENGNLRFGQVSPGIRPWEGLHPPGLTDTEVRDWNLSSTGIRPWDGLHLPGLTDTKVRLDISLRRYALPPKIASQNSWALH